MRGFLGPSIKAIATESQKTFRTLSRGRRSKIARAAQTTLVKADQWGKGGAVPSEVADALDIALKAATKAKK
jgi:hypothetical protein